MSLPIIYITQNKGRLKIQIPYFFIQSIHDYRLEIKTGEWKFPKFNNYCPICGSKNCTVRIGYYFRYYIDIETGVILLIAITRYKCQRKGKASLKDKTFSLLPYFLIPYHRLTINSYMYIWRNKLIKNKSKSTISDEVTGSFKIDKELNYEERYIDRSLSLFRQTVSKIIDFLNRNNQDIIFLKGKEKLEEAWLFLATFKDDSGIYSGAPGFSIYSYEKQGGYRTNPQFMFGTAYQFYKTPE